MGVADVGVGQCFWSSSGLGKTAARKKTRYASQRRAFFELVGPCVYIKQVSYRL